MPATVNESAFDYAKRLIKDGEYVVDERDAWGRHQPTAAQENSFIEAHGYREYARWHLGIDDDHGEETKARYKFPYGDFAKLHRCAVLAAEARAGQQKYLDIERAAAHLRGMLAALQ
ncbi:MAG: hypothetical protein QOG22_2571 [Pseudonocardiales bacterium]|nr:hypothetical protein [Pseudonocardiales bacterium]MDT4985873.1 hypothetical protein [Pseudonocardiales bacterium]